MENPPRQHALMERSSKFLLSKKLQDYWYAPSFYRITSLMTSH
jgi:hypothetical protein